MEPSKQSGPKAYVAVRQEDINGSADSTYHVEVDGKPYFPFLSVDPNDHASIRETVNQILFKSKNSAADESNAIVQDSSTWSITVIQGGITNQLFRVDLGTKSTGNNGNDESPMPLSVLLRIFGAEGMIDRDVEASTFAALASQGLSPSYYGRFANGRIEGWLDGMKPLTPRELADPVLSHKIAQQMAHLHSQFKTPPLLEEYHNPHQPTLWSQLQDWMDQAQKATFRNEAETKRAHETVTPMLPKLLTEFQWLRQNVVPTDAPVAFCHNDALAGNILQDTNGKGTVRLIDFEYGGINYRAFDIANHFNEYSGGTENGGVHNFDWFPQKEHQLAFLKTYLEACNADSNDNGAAATTVTKEVIHSWYEQVQAFIMVNLLYWGTWAVNQAATEGCEDFDYLLFGHSRLSRYFEIKAEMYPSS